MFEVLKRMVTVAALAAALIGQVGPALAQWHGGPPGHGYYGPPRHGPHWRPVPEVVMIYPAPPPPSPQVVYVQPAPVQPAPIQAVPASDPFIDGQGRYCREYQSVVTVAGQPQQSYGTACRMPDGQWRIVQ